MPDYYALLEIDPTATAAEIRKAYRRLARQHHPDLNQQAQEAHIRQLNEAYEVLRNPQRRALYDTQRAALEAARLRQQEQARRAAEMTWVEGIFGFIRELKRELRQK